MWYTSLNFRGGANFLLFSGFSFSNEIKRKISEYTVHVCSVHLVFISYWQLLRHNEQGLPRGAAGPCPPALLGHLHPAAGDGGPGGGIGVRGLALGHEVPRKKLIL